AKNGRTKDDGARRVLIIDPCEPRREPRLHQIDLARDGIAAFEINPVSVAGAIWPDIGAKHRPFREMARNWIANGRMLIVGDRGRGVLLEQSGLRIDLPQHRGGVEDAPANFPIAIPMTQHVAGVLEEAWIPRIVRAADLRIVPAGGLVTGEVVG